MLTLALVKWADYSDERRKYKIIQEIPEFTRESDEKLTIQLLDYEEKYDEISVSWLVP